MARAVHRVALLVLPSLPERATDDVRRAWDRLIEVDLVRTEDRTMGSPGARRVMEGGFANAWVDHGGLRSAPFAEPAPIRFVSNRLGGFHADCAVCGAAQAGPFSRALEAWRRGGPRRMRCVACGTDADLASLRFSPDAGLARAWLVFEDAGSVELDPAARGLLEDVLGGVRIVLRRG